MNSIILYENLLADGTLSVTSTSTEAGYDKDNLIDFRAYTRWKASSTATNYITVALSAADGADCLGIFNHNLGTIGATVKVQKTTGTWATVLTITPSDDYAILETFTLSSDADWRIEISGASDPVDIGIIYLGTKLSFGIGPQTPTIPKSEGIVAKEEVSKAGFPLGVDIRYNDIISNPTYKVVDRTWVQTYYRPFWNNHGRLLKPFFYAWDIDDSSSEIVFVKFSSGMRYEEPVSLLNYVDYLTLQLEGIAE